MRVSALSVQEVDESVDCSNVAGLELRIFWEAPIQLVDAKTNDSRGQNSDKAIGPGLCLTKNE